jgi:hypothetical protein
MPTPTVVSSGDFVRPFNGSDQDSPDQGSHCLVLTAAQRIWCCWFSGACETMWKVPQCTGRLVLYPFVTSLLTYLHTTTELCSISDKPEGPLWYGCYWLFTSTLSFGWIQCKQVYLIVNCRLWGISPSPGITQQNECLLTGGWVLVPLRYLFCSPSSLLPDE